MTYLIWSILNTGILIYFIYIIVGFISRGKQFFKPQFKNISIFLLILGTIQIISAAILEKNKNEINLTDNYDKKKKIITKKVILENNLTFEIDMHLKYSIDQNEFIPIKSTSSLTGFVSGYVWEYNFIDAANPKQNEQARFTAHGILKWNLFGITIYSQSKKFNGSLKL